MYATVNGARLAYWDHGQAHKVALLLVHGFPLDHRLWRAQLDGLSSLVRVIAPDLAGHGISGSPAHPYSMDWYADDLAALLNHLGVERVILAGLSMGGYIAFAFWRRHPERVRALVLMDTRAEPDSSQDRSNRDASAARVQAAGAQSFVREMLPRLLAPQNLSGGRAVDEALRMMASQPVSGIIGALGALRDRADSRPTLPAITVPTLVLVGEADALTPPKDGEAMAQAIPDAQMIVVSDAGHLSPMENPRAVNAALRVFIRRVGP